VSVVTAVAQAGLKGAVVLRILHEMRQYARQHPDTLAATRQA
jgi:hypothetical protein